MKHFDPDLLNTLVTFADTGSLARTAAIVGRTASAVTAQVQRLEENLGVALLEANGRGRVLTEAGMRLVGHARRILASNHEAWLSITGAAADGKISLGITQDFADSDLPDLLNLFARSHSRLRIELRVGRTAELSKQLEDGQIDIVVAMRRENAGEEVAVFSEPMCWLWAANGLAGPSDEIPLALLDAPCGFRDAALKAMDKLGRPYRLSATSTSLAGLRVAVRAGLAITARTSRWTSGDIVAVPAALRLPELPSAEFSITMRPGSRGPVVSLAELLADGLIPNRRQSSNSPDRARRSI